MEIRLARSGELWIEAPPDPPTRIAAGALARRLDVAESTVLRWARTGRCPRLAELAIESLILGRLPHRRWRGWRLDVRDGRLYSPTDYPFTAAELEHRLFVYQHRDVLRATVAQLEHELADARARGEAAARRRLAARAGPARCRRRPRPARPLELIAGKG